MIIRANNSRDHDKLRTLFELREELEQLKLATRLCKEVRVFHNFNSFQFAINQVIDISKQNLVSIKDEGL